MNLCMYLPNGQSDVKVRAGIIGATGYAGAEIVRLLAAHPNVEIAWIGSRSNAGETLSSIYKNLFRIVDLPLVDHEDPEPEVTADLPVREAILKLAQDVDVIFTATPQGACAQLVSEELLSGTRVIDLSADVRLKDVAVYEKWYGIQHAAPEFIREAVYGLTELNREKIRETRILANPGCYTTCSILTAYPLIAEGLIDPDTLIIDALSGVSGAGRSAKTANLYSEVNESVKAYGVAGHRHTPEIEEQLTYARRQKDAEAAPVLVNFTPHLIPMNRGILATEYASLVKDGDGAPVSDDRVRAAYEKYYGNEPFIRILGAGSCPETRFVEGSNYVDIGWKIDVRTGRIIAMGALDNLMKGAASQAVQNMNVMFGLPENAGISMIPMVP